MTTSAQIRLEVELDELQRLDIASLRERWRLRFKTDPPELRSKTLLRHSFAHRLQIKIHGDLSIGLKRQLVNLAKRLDDPAFYPAARDALPAGTALVREWNNERHVVLIEEQGFRYRDQTYRSLTAAAKAITGTHWNGREFFKLDRAT